MFNGTFAFIINYLLMTLIIPLIKEISHMKFILILTWLLLSLFSLSFAQTGIGTTDPDNNAALEVKSTNKGILIPRIALEATTSFMPMSAHIAGMIVYNTATTSNTASVGNPPNNVSPGFYYNDGSKWLRLLAGFNADLSPDAWIDDNDNAQIELGTLSDGTSARPAGSEFMVKDNGNIGIGTADPSAKLQVNGNIRVSEISQVSTGSRFDSVAVYGLNGELNRTDLNSFFSKRRELLVRIFATKGTAQSIATDTPTRVIGWNTTQIENATTGGDWIETTGEFTVSKAGWYRVTATLTYAKGNITAGKEYNVQVRRNGTGPPVGSLPHFTETTNSSVPEGIAINTGLLTTIVNCAVGDKLSVWTFHNQGSARSLIITFNPSLSTMIIEQL